MPSGWAAKASAAEQESAAEQASPTSLSWPGPEGRTPWPTNAPHQVPAGPLRARRRVGRAAGGEVRLRPPCAPCECGEHPHVARGFGSESDSAGSGSEGR